MDADGSGDQERLLRIEDAAHDTTLTRRFVALADALVTDYEVTDLLDQLVYTCVDLLPVAQAGLILLDGTGSPQLVASTSEHARMLELFQLEGEEGGPCVACLGTGTVVSVDDLAAPGLPWPGFAARATGAGFRSVHAVPLRLRDDVIGALNLFGHEVGPAEQDWNIAQALADMATIAILQQRAVLRSAGTAEQLQAALDGRVVIEQAKGILAEYGKVDMDAAFAALRSYARASNLRLSDVAGSLATGTRAPADVMDALLRD